MKKNKTKNSEKSNDIQKAEKLEKFKKSFKRYNNIYERYKISRDSL
jgi:hypothetical protein